MEIDNIIKAIKGLEKGVNIKTGEKIFNEKENKILIDDLIKAKEILKKEQNDPNPPKYYGYMTFQEYLNQKHIKRRHGVKVKREDCTQIIESHMNNKYFKKIIILTIDREQYAYFLKYDSRLLFTMDRDYNPLSPSCFIYDDD